MTNEAFTQLVDAHYAPLYRFALSLARNGSDAGDLVQQTFFIWATKGHGIRELSKAKSWLFTTLYREFLRARRRDSRSSSLEDLPPGENEPIAEDAGRLTRIDSAAVMSALQAVDEPCPAPRAPEAAPRGKNEPIAEAAARLPPIDSAAVMSPLQAVAEPFRAPLTLF